MSLLSFLDEFLEYFFGDDYEEDTSIISASDRSSKSDSDTRLLITRFIGIGLFALLFLITLGLYIFRRMKAGKKLPTMVVTFYIGLPIFILLRITWIILKIEADSGIFGPTLRAVKAAGSLCNRLAMCVFLYVFNTLLFYWIDTIHTTINVSIAKQAFTGGTDFSFVSRKGRVFFYGAIVLVIILVLVLVIVRVGINLSNLDLSAPDCKKKKAISKGIEGANDIIISFVFLIFGGCFLVYGTMLNFRIRKQAKSKLSQFVMSELFSVGIFVCFLVRFVLFSISAITGRKDLNQSVYEVLTYYLAELGPSVLILLSLNSKVFGEAEAAAPAGSNQDDFVDPLLAEQEEAENQLL